MNSKFASGKPKRDRPISAKQHSVAQRKREEYAAVRLQAIVRGRNIRSDAVAAAKAENRAESVPAKATPSNRGFVLTSSQNPDARATLTIRPERATNLLVSQGLPQLRAGQTYRLWAETPLGLQGCMAFRPDAEGNATIQVPREPSSSAISLLISIDPIYTGSSAESPGRPVLTSI